MGSGQYEKKATGATFFSPRTVIAVLHCPRIGDVDG